LQEYIINDPNSETSLLRYLAQDRKYNDRPDIFEEKITKSYSRDTGDSISNLLDGYVLNRLELKLSNPVRIKLYSAASHIFYISLEESTEYNIIFDPPLLSDGAFSVLRFVANNDIPQMNIVLKYMLVHDRKFYINKLTEFYKKMPNGITIKDWN
jgi:hypothetical protein